MGRDMAGPALLRRPVYRPLWKAARRRLEANGLSLGGAPLAPQALTAEEADAVAGLIAVPRPVNGSVRIPLTVLDQALRGSVAGQGLIDVVTAIGSPPLDRRTARERSQTDRDKL